jgi:hypothetical protein
VSGWTSVPEPPGQQEAMPVGEWRGKEWHLTRQISVPCPFSWVAPVLSALPPRTDVPKCLELRRFPAAISPPFSKTSPLNSNHQSIS